MKKFLLFLALFAFGGLLHAEGLSKTVTLTVDDLKGVSSISMDFVNGSGEIVGKKTNKVEIYAVIKISGKDETTLEEALRNAQITVKKSKDSLLISLNYDKLKKYTGDCGGFWDFFASVSKRVNISVKLKAVIPQGFSLDLNGVNFDLTVKNLNKIDVSTVNGNIEAEKVNKAECESVNGNITVKGVVYKVNCEVVNGNLTVNTDSLKMTDIDLESVNGNAHIVIPEKAVHKIDTSSLTSKTVLKRGDETVKGKNLSWKGKGSCDISVETINGAINITLK